MASPRIERDALLFRVDAELDAMQRPIARAVVASVRRHAVETPEGQRLTPMSRARILNDTDTALDAMFGRVPGDTTAPLYQLIVRRAREAALLPVAAAVADIRHRLRGESELLDVIEGDGS